MKKINDITTALDLFKEAAATQLEATKNGDYKTGNKCYDKIVQVVIFLKNEDSIDGLFNLLFDQSIRVRLWAATYLLSTHEKDAIKTLKEIVKTQGIQSLIAETTLVEWKNGTLEI